MSELKPGDKAPDFTLPADGGGTLSLKQLRGKPVILYFYPKDDTPGCTTEACGFRDSLPDFSKTGATVIGLSRDSAASHDKFKRKHGLSFLLDGKGAIRRIWRKVKVPGHVDEVLAAVRAL